MFIITLVVWPTRTEEHVLNNETFSLTSCSERTTRLSSIGSDWYLKLVHVNFVLYTKLTISAMSIGSPINEN